MCTCVYTYELYTYTYLTINSGRGYEFEKRANEGGLEKGKERKKWFDYNLKN